MKLFCSFLCLLALLSVNATSEESYYSVSYPASDKEGELSMEATFHIWLPPGVKKIRAVIVHQHGCGDGAEMSGEKAAQDLHWQALASKHDAALLSPHYKAKGANCRLWCDPRNGSNNTFLKALDDLAQLSSHPELADVPWCLWGHSGGGFWASLMLEKHPERIVAMFCRSGTAMSAWSKGEIPPPQYRPEAFQVPIILNPGLKERGDKQFNGAWTASVDFFNLLREQGAPVAFAPDPFSSHECRNSRLLAIPFFDRCLALRLPQTGKALKPLPANRLYGGDWEAGMAMPLKETLGSAEVSILPDKQVASAYEEYVKKGFTTDFSAPKKAPIISTAKRGKEQGEVMIEWSAEADLESGIRQFAIYRNGDLLTLFPEKPKDPTGFAQFQTLSYHDTPTPDAPALRFIDRTAPSGKIEYAIATVNGAGIEGKRSKKVAAQ
ncbi:MAG: hypothetical protein ACO1QB_03830 [Verrucomicrobiales bacterium]